MKVLHIITGDTWAGAEAQATALIAAQSEGYGLQEQVITFNKGVLSDRLGNENCEVTIANESENSPLALLNACRGVMARFKPAIVHTHGFKENFIGGMAARLTKAKVVRTHHGRGVIGGARRNDILETLNARFLSDALIPVSHDLEVFLSQCGLPRKKMTVVLNGIRPLSPSPAQAVMDMKMSLGLPRESIVIGTIGRLVPVKNHAAFLEGARLVTEARPDIRIVIIGDGPLRAALMARADVLGIAEKTVFAGFREDAARLGEVFDLFALTSRHEGIPMALLEAMSLGKAVVATAVGGIPEIITHEMNGLLVPENDPREFASACLEMVSNVTLRCRLAAQAAEDIRNRHSLDIAVKSTVEVYKKVLTL